MRKLFLIFLLIPYFGISQVIIPGSSLPTTSAINGTDYFILIQGPVTKKIAYSVFRWNADSTARVVRDSLTNYTKLSYLSSQLAIKQGLDATLTALAGLTITESSLIYGTAADAFSVLPKGTAGQALKMNAGATAPEWAIVGGTPAGNNREIQFNNNGVFGADAKFKWDGIRLHLTTGSGWDNLFIGEDTGPLSIGSAIDNIGIGIMSLNAITDGAARNVMMGAFSGLYITNGDDNVGYGTQACGQVTTGSSNTAIGTDALYGNLIGAGNVAIGWRAGYYETDSNKLFIDNQARTNKATSRISSLIYGEFHATVANQLFRVNGKLQTLQFSGELTDNTPTAAEIVAIVGTAVGKAGLKITIRDTTGTLLLYLCESDGTDWYYTGMTKAL